MRAAFIRALLDLAERDDRICLVVGDLGYSIVEPFVERFPTRYLNVGVAEQNMTGIATGMALCGKVVFTYSIANFPTLRCVEQVRNDVCYHHADVKIVSVGGGLAYGALGITHHATEDVAVMRALPCTVVVAPGDPVEAELATQAVVEQPGPCYLRLGKSGEPRIHQPGVDFSLGKAITVREGDDLCLIATGSMLYNAVKVAELLSRDGIQTRVLSMHTIKPLDTEAVLGAARETSAIVTIEEHSVTGGLGSAVAETLAEFNEFRVPFKRLGLPPVFTSLVGNHEYLKEAYSLSVEGICRSLELILDHVRNAK
jgi:transketolase